MYNTIFVTLETEQLLFLNMTNSFDLYYLFLNTLSGFNA